MKIISKIPDKDGTPFDLWDSVWEHITTYHPEIDSVDELKDVLKSPEYIVRSKWSSPSLLYYRKINGYYRVVVVDTLEKRIKTCYTTTSLKAGEALWKKND